LIDFQTQALKQHENLLLYEKLFDFELVSKLKVTQEELNVPNFIELCVEKAKKSKSNVNSRVLLKFGAQKLFIHELDQEPVEQAYKNVVYLNNSITNECFFCLAYSANHSRMTSIDVSFKFFNKLKGKTILQA
jgi:hypothetical protein